MFNFWPKFNSLQKCIDWLGNLPLVKHASNAKRRSKTNTGAQKMSIGLSNISLCKNKTIRPHERKYTARNINEVLKSENNYLYPIWSLYTAESSSFSRRSNLE